MREIDECKKLTLRRELARSKQSGEIVEKILAQIKEQHKYYLKQVNIIELDEVSRRIGMLTQKFVADCLKKVNGVFQNLKIHVSSATMVSKVMEMMEQQIFVIPEIGVTKCVLVRSCIAEIISQTVIRIKNQRLKSVKNGSFRMSQLDIGNAGVKKSKSIDQLSKKVCVNDSKEVIGTSSYDEFIGSVKSVMRRKQEKTV